MNSWSTLDGLVRLALLVALTCAVSGCDATSAPTAGVGAEKASAASGSELALVDGAQLEELIAQHQGQVVLVDFWATWCLPCLEQLPHTIELSEQHREKGLRVVTVSLDDPSERAGVRELLDSNGATRTTNAISRYGASPQSMETFEIASGGVPYYKLYDRAGMLRFTFGVDPASDQQYDQADIDAAVQQLLGE